MPRQQCVVNPISWMALGKSHNIAIPSWLSYQWLRSHRHDKQALFLMTVQFFFQCSKVSNTKSHLLYSGHWLLVWKNEQSCRAMTVWWSLNFFLPEKLLAATLRVKTQRETCRFSLLWEELLKGHHLAMQGKSSSYFTIRAGYRRSNGK